jgi:Pectate lyase superfamily protein
VVNTPDWLNVMNYGARGNGNADDTAAIQSAITAAVTAKAGVVYLPAGTYLVSAPLRVTAAISVIGDGREATTILLKSGTDDYAVKFTQASGAITGARFADFAINGNAANQTGGGGIGAVGAVQCSFERVWFTSCYNWGLALEGQPGGAFGHHNRIIGCTFDGAQAAGIGGGVWATSSDENFYYGCDFEYLGGVTAPPGAGDYPVALLDQAGLQQITSCCFVGSRGNDTQIIGVRVQNTASTRIIGCTFDGVGGDNVLIAGTDCVIAGNEFSAIGDQCPTAGVSAGVHLEHGSLRTAVTANNFSSSPANGKTGWLIYEEQIGNSGSNVIQANTLRVMGSVANARIATDGVASLVRSNIGYNPVGALKAPVIPASGRPLVNPFNVDCSVFITGGTVSTVQISGVTTGLTSGQFLVNAGQPITLTYTAAPSWTWIGNLPVPARP